jgi:iron(III) transport system ATP-binding protein
MYWGALQDNTGIIIHETPAISLNNVSREYGRSRALADVSLSVSPGEIICLVGQSGCGKSTLLRIIAGIDNEHRGEVRLFGKSVASENVFVEPEQRRVGFMFQDYALFPHLTVFENVRFGVRRQADGDRLAAQTIERLNLGNLQDKYPHMLSGGEQQRVALARALTPQPPILLMDEPFSNLDRRLAENIRSQTLAILRDLKTTAIIVTHDPEEALGSSDRIALMRDGKFVQVGTGYELYYHPNSRYTADYFCSYNKIPAKIMGDQLVTSIGSFPSAFDGADGSSATVYIRPQSISVSREGNGTPCLIIGRSFRGDAEHLTLQVEGQQMTLSAHIPYILPDGDDRVRIVLPSIGMLSFKNE